nr:GAF domain-containing protein [Caulobacter sp. B11]
MSLIAAGRDLPEVLEAIVRSVEAQDPNILCSILLLDEARERLLVGAAPGLPDSYNQAIHGTLIGPKAGSCGTALFLGRKVIVESIATDPLWEDYKDLAKAAGLASCWSAPIFVEGSLWAPSPSIRASPVSRPRRISASSKRRPIWRPSRSDAIVLTPVWRPVWRANRPPPRCRRRPRATCRVSSTSRSTCCASPAWTAGSSSLASAGRPPWATRSRR